MHNRGGPRRFIVPSNLANFEIQDAENECLMLAIQLGDLEYNRIGLSSTSDLPLGRIGSRLGPPLSKGTNICRSVYFYIKFTKKKWPALIFRVSI